MSGRTLLGPRPTPVTPAPRDTVQTKLRVSRAGDLHEREADRVAEEVAGREPRASLPAVPSPPPPPADADDALARAASAGAGSPLDSAVRSFFEQRMGHDFGGIRIHADRPAAEAAGALQARAFTRGRHLYFSEGEYRPATPAGRHLLAHELTHAVQQRGGPAAPDAVARKVAPPDQSAAAAAVSEITAILLVDPEDGAGQARLRIAELDPLIRMAVVQQVLTRVPPEARDKLAQQLAEPFPAPTEPEDHAGGSPAPAHIVGVSASPAPVSPTATTPVTQAAPTVGGGPAPEALPATSPPTVKENAEIAQPPPAVVERPGAGSAESVGGDAAVGETAIEAAAAPDLGARVEPLTAESGDDQPATDTAPPVADVGPFLARLEAAAAGAEQTVAAKSRVARSKLSSRAAALRETVNQRVEARATEIHLAFGATHNHLDGSVRAARKQIAAALKARLAEVDVSSDAARTRFSKQFGDHRKNVDSAVATAVSDGEKQKTDAQKRVRDETTRQANEARAKGEQLAAEYPNTDRGAVQKEAARAIADKTALEMQEQVPEAVAACGDVVEELPKGFRKGGAQLLEGFDSGLPALLASVDEQSGNTKNGLGPQALQAQDALDTEAAGVHAQLDSLEQQAVSQARDVGPLITGQIDAALRAAHAQVRQGAVSAVGRIREVVDQAAAVLTGAEAPDPGSAETFTAEIEAFAGAASAGAGDLLQETAVSVGGALSRAVTDAEAALRKVEQQAAKRRDDLTTAVDKGIADFVAAADKQLGESVAALTKLFDDKAAEIDTKLTAVLTNLKSAFATTLDQVRLKLDEMIDSALKKNDDLLFTLRVEMRRGASDAAWEYDHPIRAAIGTALQIIGGIILGLLAIAVLVVIAIVAFKLAVAGLVAIGFSTAVATAIVVVAGLALLAYGAYSAYSTRRRHGESVGMALLGAVGDVTGISEIIRGATRPHLSPFDRAYSIAHGAGTLVALVLPFAKGPMGRINGVIDSFLPGAVVNPSQGAAWRALGRALGVGKNAPAFGGGLFGRGGVPDVGVLPKIGEVTPGPKPAGTGAEPPPTVELPKLVEPPKVVEPAKIAEPPKAAGLPKPAEPPTVSEPTAPASRSVVKPAATAEPRAPLRLVKPRPPSPAKAANDNAIPLPKAPQPQSAVPPKGTAPPPELLPAQASKAVALVEAAEEAALVAAEAAPQKLAAVGGGSRPGGSGTLDVRASGPTGGQGPSGPIRPPGPGRGGTGRVEPASPATGPRRSGGGPEPPKPAEPTLPERLEAIRQQEPANAADELAALAAERKPRLEALDKEISRLEQEITRLGNERASARDLARARLGKKIDQLTKQRDALKADRDPLAREVAQIGQDTRLNAYRLHPEWKSELPCFGAGTPVWTEGGPRPIEQITEGERVWAFSFDQGEPVLCRVSAATRGLSDHFYQVRAAGQTVPVTGAHLFWIDELDTWVPARELAPGMRLRNLSVESSTQIEAVALVEQTEPQLTFNLSVDGAPSYYVGAGVLVHNTLPPAGPLPPYKFGPLTVYEGVYEGSDPVLKAKYGDRIYIGQTEQPLGVREGQHQWEAAAELKKPGLTAAEREFWEFKRHMKLRPRVIGLDAAQADYFEQLNLNVERESRRMSGKGEVVYRREQAVPKRFRALAEAIAKDPRVRAAGFCLR